MSEATSEATPCHATRFAVAGGLRSLVLEAVARDAGVIDRISAGLALPRLSVEKMLTVARWDLELALRVVDHLGLVFEIRPSIVDPPPTRERSAASAAHQS